MLKYKRQKNAQNMLKVNGQGHLIDVLGIYTLFYLLFVCHTANFGPLLRDSPTYPMLITALLKIWPDGHREPRNKNGSLSSAECLVELEPGTFKF